jgi:hypothetical protein
VLRILRNVHCDGCKSLVHERDLFPRHFVRHPQSPSIDHNACRHPRSQRSTSRRSLASGRSSANSRTLGVRTSRRIRRSGSTSSYNARVMRSASRLTPPISDPSASSRASGANGSREVADGVRGPKTAAFNSSVARPSPPRKSASDSAGLRGGHGRGRVGAWGQARRHRRRVVTGSLLGRCLYGGIDRKEATHGNRQEGRFAGEQAASRQEVLAVREECRGIGLVPGEGQGKRSSSRRTLTKL